MGYVSPRQKYLRWVEYRDKQFLLLNKSIWAGILLIIGIIIIMLPLFSVSVPVWLMATAVVAVCVAAGWFIHLYMMNTDPDIEEGRKQVDDTDKKIDKNGEMTPEDKWRAHQANHRTTGTYEEHSFFELPFKIINDLISGGGSFFAYLCLGVGSFIAYKESKEHVK